MSFWASCTKNDSLLYTKLPPHLKRSINLARLENGTYDQIVAYLEQELELSGLETDGELPIPAMATTTTTVNKKTQPRNAQQQQIVCRLAKNQELSSKNVGNALVKSMSFRVKKKLPKDQMQKHSHPVHTAEQLTTQKTWADADMAQTRLTDPKGTKLRILTTQQTTFINQERVYKMSQLLSSGIL